MPTTRADSYSAASGGGIYAGVDAPNDAPAFGVSDLTAFIGDSMTEHQFGVCPWYWLNGLIGAPLDVIANSGHSGQSVFGLVAQIDADYHEATAPGLLNLPPLGWVFVRIGTNNVRDFEGDGPGTPLDAGFQASYTALFAGLKGYAEHVVVFPVPPIGGVAVTKNTEVASWNAWLQSVCDADDRLHWIDDCADLVDGSGNIIPEYFDTDELHFSGAGTYRMALTAQASLAALLSNQGYTSALVTDAADVYPAQPQWSPNPTMTGTGGTKGSGWSGTLPDGYRVETYGSGLAGAASIVAADAEDANQVPWLRITQSATDAAGAVTIKWAGAGSGDPDTFEQLIEFRFNALTAASELWYWMQTSSGAVTKYAKLKWNGLITALTDTVTLRQKFYSLNAGSISTVDLYIYMFNSGSGGTGSFDIRCPTVRG